MESTLQRPALAAAGGGVQPPRLPRLLPGGTLVGQAPRRGAAAGVLLLAPAAGHAGERLNRVQPAVLMSPVPPSSGHLCFARKMCYFFLQGKAYMNATSH